MADRVIEQCDMGYRSNVEWRGCGCFKICFPGGFHSCRSAVLAYCIWYQRVQRIHARCECSAFVLSQSMNSNDLVSCAKQCSFYHIYNYHRLATKMDMAKATLVPLGVSDCFYIQTHCKYNARTSLHILSRRIPPVQRRSGPQLRTSQAPAGM